MSDYIREIIEVWTPSRCADVEREMEVIGELISNLYGAVEVQKEIAQGTKPKKML